MNTIDPSTAAAGPHHGYGLGPVVLFDGVCNLCNSSVLFIIKRDRRGRFRFAALQSDAGASLLASSAPAGPAGPALPLPDSIVLVEDGCVLTQSTAALRIARRLRFPWPLLYALAIVPRPIRDLIYAWIARNRYRWFGRRDRCMVPTPELRARFLP
jgi:predicted DCC family thiol-disulfide oxidoreductase YuxK